MYNIHVFPLLYLHILDDPSNFRLNEFSPTSIPTDTSIPHNLPQNVTKNVKLNPSYSHRGDQNFYLSICDLSFPHITCND